MQFDKTGDLKRSLSIKKRLFLLLTVMLLPFISFSLYKAFDINKHLEKETQIGSLNLAKNVARDIDDYIISTGELLVPIASNKDVRTQNYPAVKAWLEEIWPKYPSYSNIIYVDNNGDIQADGRSKGNSSNEKINVSDTAYYKRAMQSDSVSVGDFMYGKISGTPVVHVTYPVFDLDGNRIGFVAAAFDLTKIQKRLMEFGVPKHTVVAVLDERGTMIARNIEPGKWVGENLSEQMGFGKMLGKAEGTGKVENPDGTTRVYGFAAVSKVPWYVRVGVDYTYIQSQVRDELINHFAIFIPLLLVALSGWLWIGRDVDRLHKKTEYLTLVDPLTELWNYRKLNHDLDKEFNRSKRYKELLSFAMIDIDHFKNYNDTNGHQAGDEALKKVASVLRGAVRDIDSAYRCGGEELCILLPQTGKDGVIAVAERIRDEIEKIRFTGEENQPSGKLTVSIGVATYPYDSISKEGLMKSADIALYKAKGNGRNKVESYTSEDVVNFLS